LPGIEMPPHFASSCKNAIIGASPSFRGHTVKHALYACTYIGRSVFALKNIFKRVSFIHMSVICIFCIMCEPVHAE
jgi:hypothetical protein